MNGNFYKCTECGLITDEPAELKDYTDVGDQSLCYATWLICPSCGGDVDEFDYDEENEESEDE